MKNKVLIIIPSLEVGGGAEKVAASLTKKLAEKYDIYILTFYNYREIYSFSGNYFSLNLKQKTWRKLLLPFKIFKLIKFISPNIIISFMEHTNILTILVKFIFQLKIPLIICNHNNPKLAYKNNKRYMLFLIKRLYKLNLVNLLITLSKDLQNFFKRECNIKKEKVITIYNGINTQEITDLSKAKISYEEIFKDEDIIKFITVGRLIESKGHNYLITAFFKVKNKIPNSKLIIIGEGNMRRQLELLIEQKNLNKDVYLLGFKKNPYKYLSKSDIFILSSEFEAFPLVLLEALACGLPIISTNCKTGPKEILSNGQYGLLTKVMDSDDLAKKMIFLAKSKNLMLKFAERSLKRSKDFDINKISEVWFNLLDSYIN